MTSQSRKTSKRARQTRFPVLQIKVQDGRFQIVGLGVWHSYWRDPYHLLLTIPWLGF